MVTVTPSQPAQDQRRHLRLATGPNYEFMLESVGRLVKTFKVNGANISHISEKNIRVNDSEFYESSWQHLGGTKYALSIRTVRWIRTTQISADDEAILNAGRARERLQRKNQLQKVDEDTYLLSYEGVALTVS